MHDLQKIIASEKRLSVFPGWSKPDETQFSWFDAPIEIAGVTETGLVLHGGCFLNRADCNVTFELRIAKAHGQKRIALERLDWRSLRGGHSNPRRRGNPLSGVRVSQSHLHAFDLNYSVVKRKMREGNLKMAQEIDPEPQDFESVRDLVGTRLGITNIDVVSRPNWEYDLFGGDY